MNRIRSKPLPGARVNPSHPLAFGLRGCWLFNEGAGVSFDAVNRVSATPGSGVTWQGGFDGPSLSYATSQTVCGTSSALDITGGNISIAAWIRPTNVSGFRQIVAKSSGAAGGSRQYGLNLNGTALAMDTTNETNGNVGGTIVANVWQHVMATYDGSFKRGYINGVKTATDFSNSNLISSQSAAVQFGNFPGNLAPFLGQIGMVCIWARTLSAGEAVMLYTNPYAMIMPSYAMRTYSFGKKIQSKVALLEAA